MENLTLGSHRLVHLDLKGAPPRISYFEQLFPLLRDWGATGLLIEWEDTFPYTRELSAIGSKGPGNRGGAYSVVEAKQILQLANDNGLIVIPLVQTFGHLEFVLKHSQWKALREVEAYPSSMCPSHPGAMTLVTEMIKQIVEFHPDIQYLHIGADEVWHMGLCPTCVRRAESNQLGRAHLFLEHVQSVAQLVRSSYPNLTVIIWDDMLREVSTQALRSYNLGQFVEPMIWHYQAAESFQLPSDMWDKYCSVFSNFWVATAFKGSTGSCQIVPIIQHHLSNHEHWLHILSKEVNKFQNFRGVALTGWSRYDHYATMCELLPCSIPSLALCMKVWTSGGYSPAIYSTVSKALGYTEISLDLIPYPRPRQVANQLNFPGWRISAGVEWHLNYKAKYKTVVESDQIATWLNSWQVEHGFTNPMQLESLIPAFTDLFFELSSLEEFLKTAMDEFLYPATTYEWLGTHLEPLKIRLKQIKLDAESQILQGVRSPPPACSF